jgi:hypothetical protein
MLPFMSVKIGGEYDRFGLERGVGYANPNAMAAWFGFCVLYLTIKGYVEARPAYRLAAWLMAVVSLYIATLAVSRGAIIAIAASLLVTSRQLLRVGLFPALILAGLLFGLVEIGVFDRAINAFSRRGAEDSGRLQIWQFINSPLIGKGASHARAFTNGIFRTPHNSFLLFAVASGIVPLLLVCAYCFRSGMAAVRANSADQDFMFYLPLVVYTVLITSAGNLDFMTPWAIVSLAVPIAASSTKYTRTIKNNRALALQDESRSPSSSQSQQMK